MIKFINDLPNDFRDQLNTGIMNKEFDLPIEEYIYQAFKGLEILPNIKIMGYEWVPDEDKYDVNDHVMRRNVNKKKVIKNVTETRCGVMYIDIMVKALNPKTGNEEAHFLKKPIIIPIKDDNGYYHIKGKKCYLIYQLVDKMLYPSFGAVTIKSLMPICVKIVKENIPDVTETNHVIPIYNIQIFKSAINVLMIYSNLGITKTLDFMEVNRFIRVEQKQESYPASDAVLRFECGKKSDCVVVVKKDIFEEEMYVKSMTGCLVKLFEEHKVQYANIDNWEEWMILAGGKNTIRRGQYQHVFFNRLLDDVTRAELKIDDYDKQNIYYLLRWIIGNYHVLWAKDNLSMEHKRLRCNEYVGSLITAEISKRINRIVSLGDKAGIKEYMNMFKFPEDIFITRLYGSGVLRYSENNSDQDSASHWKLTKKGPNSLGANDTRRIPIRQRSLHPSMVGFLDCSETSSSDPGQSSSIIPYNNMKSLYFDDSLYENEIHFKMHQHCNNNPRGEDWEELVIRCDTEREFNDALNTLAKACNDKIIISGTSNNPLEIIIEKDPRDNYRKFDESFLVSAKGED